MLKKRKKHVKKTQKTYAKRQVKKKNNCETYQCCFFKYTILVFKMLFVLVVVQVIVVLAFSFVTSHRAQ